MAGQPEQRPPEQPWSRSEKNYLLAEIIKTANIEPNALFMFVIRSGIQPAWEDTALPPGRSLNSCRSAFRQFEQPGLPQGFEPRTPAPLSGYQPVKRSYDGSSMSGREIRPKPASGSRLSPALPIDQPPRKKRGRPTKAEAQAKAEASTASAGPTPRSEGIAPSSAGPAVRPIVETESPITASPISAAPPDLPKPILPPAARIPISSMMTQMTPTSAPEAGQSSSSSGKRKRGRSTRSDPENNPFMEEGGARQLQEFESPYGAAALEPSDTPARTAILRHRDETDAGAQRFDSQAQSPQARPEPRTDPDTK